MTFSEYIKRKRKAKRLTQADLARELATFSDDFQELDGNTVSRWERGNNLPSLYRQKKCVLFFNDDPVELLPFRATGSALDISQKVRNQIRKKLNSQRFEMLIGGLPLCSGDFAIEPYCRLSDEQYLDFIASLDRGVLDTDEPIEPFHLRTWLTYDPGSLWLGKQHGQTVSHLLILKLKPSSYRDMMLRKKKESSLTIEDLAGEDEEHCLYIVSFFCLTTDTAVEAFIHMFTVIYQCKHKLKRVGSLVGNMDGVKLCRMLSMSIHTLSSSLESGRISHGGNSYCWATLDASVDKILASPVARKSISAL